MTVDDLTTPLAQPPVQRRREFPVSVPKVIAAALALFLGAFIVWAFVSDDPFGGEPKVAVPIDQHSLAIANKPDVVTPPGAPAPAAPQAPVAAKPTETQQSRPAPPPGTKTVTIIDGKTGERREILIPPPGNEAPSTSANSKGAKQ